MNKHSKGMAFLKGKGFYAALALVIIGAAVASFLAINNMMDTLSSKENQQKMEEKQWGFEDTQVENKQKDIPIPQEKSSSSQNTAQSSTSSSDAQAAQNESSKQPQPQTASYQLPMSGQVTEPFSGDELVYNVTMGDWRTHNGMDIAGSPNQGVHAPMTGTVTKVYSDDMWGYVVELADEEYAVTLKGLSKDIKVAEGASVVKGDTVGLLGEAAAESASPQHLHIEVTKGGTLIDPASLLK
ncbi:MAG: M23 family metallopeptidase [Oscillospiraceae bacterium]